MTEESDRIAEICRKIECATRGHQISWVGSTTMPQAPPAGEYNCLECGEVVTLP